MIKQQSITVLKNIGFLEIYLSFFQELKKNIPVFFKFIPLEIHFTLRLRLNTSTLR